MSDNIKNGVHICSDMENYMRPTDPKVIEKLELFQDRKLGIMMHWAPVTQIGIIESWAMSDEDGEWSQRKIDWTDNMDEFRQQYRDLHKTFNPIKYQPEEWAKLFKTCGFKYALFTTKHHDGFCMWDTKTTDYKITSKNCPFHKHKYSDIVKHLYNAFRGEGIGIHTYFSKPDWDSPYYWCNGSASGNKTSRNPDYSIKEEPKKWEQFVQYSHEQITELMSNYGEIDCLWLDGGWVNPDNLDQDIRLGEIVDKIRATTQPGLISADRTIGGGYENFITPEQTIPQQPILVPWESCITLGRAFSFRYNDIYKTPRSIIHLFLDIVAKGGNLVLNITPQPDGDLPEKGVAVLKELGDFMKKYGEGIYGTRPCEPYRIGQYAIMKKKDLLYVFYLYEEDEKRKKSFTLPIESNILSVVKIGENIPLDYSKSDNGINVTCNILEEHKRLYAEGFCVKLANMMKK